MHAPDEAPVVPRDAHDTVQPAGMWQGPTYYGRSQLKQAPFNCWVVGGYVFLAGLSGAAALISTVADLTEGPAAEDTVRRGRYVSLLAPILGSALLVWDLHTPQRFYNMLRIAKKTSPMSIGTWILMAFSGFAFVNAGLQFAADRGGPRWLRRLARVSQVPQAVAGAGLATYTSSLLSATSTPLWAAAPQSQAVRFGASSVVAGASLLGLLERVGPRRRKLDALAVAALAAELAGSMRSHRSYRAAGVDEALDGVWGRVERNAVHRMGNVMPLVVQAASLALGRRSGTASNIAALAGMAGSLLLRVSVMEAGAVSASHPEISMRFAQPENLPRERRRGGCEGAKGRP